ncbi:MAG: hypothetical protein ACREKS_16365 [Candidatus Rokuibacteriota bacterium]
MTPTDPRRRRLRAFDDLSTPGRALLHACLYADDDATRARTDTVFKNPAPLPKYIERGLVFAGNPDTVYRGIKKMYDHLRCGFGHLLIMGQAGFLDHDETVKGMKLFAREIYPRLQALPQGG